MDELTLGKIGKYELIEKLGQGVWGLSTSDMTLTIADRLLLK